MSKIRVENDTLKTAILAYIIRSYGRLDRNYKITTEGPAVKKQSASV